MAHGGRRLYVRIPRWLAELFPQYPMKGSRGSHFLLVTGNMPGRCDAGRIWQLRFDRFLTGYGLTQLLTDRRVWTRHSPLGDLIVHDHVDDSRLTYATLAARDHFHQAWAAEFGEKIEVRPCSEDFTGLRHSVIAGTRTTTISCEGVIRRLEKLLEPHPLLGEACDWPLAATAPAHLRDGASTLDPLAPGLVEVAAPLLGTIGFITGLTRPDAHFAYCLLSRHASAARLTGRGFRHIVRLGHYLVQTKGLHLTLTAPMRVPHPDGGSTLDLFDCFVDSSHGNAEHGTSYGGFVLSSSAPPLGSEATTGGGALAWCCKAPREGDDSSAAAELRMASHAYKFVVAARNLLTELGVGAGPSKATPLHLDAQAVLDGTSCERLDKKSRWMAMRYAMLRWGILCGTIRPLKRASRDNPADGLTKCLTGLVFVQARARLLGHPVPVG